MCQAGFEPEIPDPTNVELSSLQFFVFRVSLSFSGFLHTYPDIYSMYVCVCVSVCVCVCVRVCMCARAYVHIRYESVHFMSFSCRVFLARSWCLKLCHLKRKYVTKVSVLTEN